MIHNLVNLIPPNIQGITNGQVAVRGFNSVMGTPLLNMPLAAFNVATANKGEMLATTTGVGVGLMTRPAAAIATTTVLSMIPGIGPAIAPVAGLIISWYPNAPFARSATKAVNWLTVQGKQIRHAEMGGNYTDTDYARAMRQRALSELSLSNGSSRRFIGQEAQMYHR